MYREVPEDALWWLLVYKVVGTRYIEGIKDMNEASMTTVKIIAGESIELLNLEEYKSLNFVLGCFDREWYTR